MLRVVSLSWAMSKPLISKDSQPTAASKYRNFVSHSFSLTILACAASCLTCSGSLATNCLTCDKASLLYLRSDNSCGSCADGKYAGNDGVCANCHTQCTSCTSGGNSILTDQCRCKNLISVSDMTCVASCGAGLTLSGNKCISKIILFNSPL